MAGTKQISPSEALHIGDNVVCDYVAAKSAGWEALLIHPDKQYFDLNTYQQVGEDKIPKSDMIQSVADVPDIMKTRFSKSGGVSLEE